MTCNHISTGHASGKGDDVSLGIILVLVPLSEIESIGSGLLAIVSVRSVGLLRY